MISDDVYITEEGRERLDRLKRNLELFEAKVIASGMDVMEYLHSQGYMTDEEDEWHQELERRSVPIG